MNAKQRQEAVRQEAREHLKEITQGREIYTILRKRSRTGTTKHIDLLTFEAHGPNWLTYWAATLIDGKHPTRQRADNGEGIRTSGSADDLVRSLAYHLFGNESALKQRSL